MADVISLEYINYIIISNQCGSVSRHHLTISNKQVCCCFIGDRSIRRGLFMFVIVFLCCIRWIFFHIHTHTSLHACSLYRGTFPAEIKEFKRLQWFLQLNRILMVNVCRQLLSLSVWNGYGTLIHIFKLNSRCIFHYFFLLKNQCVACILIL